MAISGPPFQNRSIGLIIGKLQGEDSINLQGGSPYGKIGKDETPSRSINQ